MECFSILSVSELLRNQGEKRIKELEKTVLCFDSLKSLGICGRGEFEIFKFVEVDKKKGFIPTGLSFSPNSLTKKLPEGYYFGQEIFRFEGPDGHFLTVPIISKKSFGFPTKKEYDKLFKGRNKANREKIPGELIKHTMAYTNTDETDPNKILIENIIVIPYGIEDENYLSLEINNLSDAPIIVFIANEFKGMWLGGAFYDIKSLEDFNQHKAPVQNSFIEKLFSEVS